MKKVLLLLVSCMFISVSMQAQAIDVEGVSLPESVKLSLDSDTTLIAVIDPINATDQLVVWTIESPAGVIEIDTSDVDKTRCKVIPKKVGEVTLTVETHDGPYKASCVISVVKLMDDMELNYQVMNLFLDEDSVLRTVIDPFDVTNLLIKWESRDSSIVDILSTEENRNDSSCYITPLKPGTVWIVAEATDSYGNLLKDSCEVTVSSRPITDFSLDYDTLDVIVGDERKIIAQIRPTEGTHKRIKWTNVMFMDGFIQITTPSESIRDTICYFTAKKVGLTKIAAETYDGQSDTCVVRVHGIPLERMTLNYDTLILDTKLHTDSILRAIVMPEATTNDSIIWSTDNAAVVKLDTAAGNYNHGKSCKIQVVAPGSAHIIAVAVDSVGAEKYKDSCYVKVIVPVDSIVLTAYVGDGTVNVIDRGNDYRRLDMDLVTDSIAHLVAKVYPENATVDAYSPLQWHKLESSEDCIRIDSITDNDSICHIKALWSGVDTIFVTTADGTVDSKWLFVHVAPRAVDRVEIDLSDQVTVTNDTIQLNVGESFEFTTSVYPYNATNDTIRLETSVSDVLKVDSTETSVRVTGLKEGESILRAFAIDGSGQKDTCVVKVRSVAAGDIKLNQDTVFVYEKEVGTVIAKITPDNVTDKAVTWTSRDASIVTINTSTGTDTICTFTGQKVDTTYIVGEINGCKDSCVVVVKERFIFAASDTTTVDGNIELWLKVPDNTMLTGSFELQLPKDFGLTKNGNNYVSALTNAFKDASVLAITAENDSTYLFQVTLKETTSSGVLPRSGTDKKVMDIGYTIYDDALRTSDSVYEVRFAHVDFTFIENGEEKGTVKDACTVKVKVFRSDTSNEGLDEQGEYIYLKDNQLHVNTPKKEIVSIYSLNGSLLMVKEKPEGMAVFTINTQEKVLIVTGSAGWSQKVLNQ